MRARLKTFILLSILILPYQLLAQKKFAVKISFPPKANIGSISIRYDNGRDANNELANVIKANQCVIAGEFFRDMLQSLLVLKLILYSTIAVSG